MRKNNQQSTNKTGNKPGPGDPKPGNKVKAEKIKADTADRPEKNNPGPKIKHLRKQPLEPVPEVKETDTQNSSPKIEMDVLHHPQLDHKPKPWKEYLLEGFMIFIAVMMGFIAENIREDITNNQHVKQLTSQLVHDLKADSIQLKGIDSGETAIVKYNDTLINLLQQPLKKADTKRMQKLVTDSHTMWIFHPSMGAISAIKNELHLKQFSNSQLIGQFSDYEAGMELLHTDQNINLQYQRIYLDPFLTAHFTPSNMVAAFGKSSQPNAQMRNLTQADLDQLASDMVLIRIISIEMVTDTRKLEKDANNMLKYVTKQYQPEDRNEKGTPEIKKPRQ